MGQRAKIFRNGGSQAVRLPKNCRFAEGQTEVVVRRAGRQIILEPVDEWPAEFLASLGAWRDGIERLTQKPIRAHRNPFDA